MYVWVIDTNIGNCSLVYSVAECQLIILNVQNHAFSQKIRGLAKILKNRQIEVYKL